MLHAEHVLMTGCRRHAAEYAENQTRPFAATACDAASVPGEQRHQ
jgi:hypothetical protein